MKVACVLITHLRAKAELQRRPHLKDQPVLIADRGKSRPLVVDHFPKAVAVSAGMSLEESLSRQAGALVLEADEPHYRRVFQQAVRALQGVGDRVEDSGLGVAYVAMDGLEALYGGDEMLARALLDALPQTLLPRVGVGHGKFPALVAARSSEPLGLTKVSEDAAAFLSSRSAGLLPVSEDTISALRRFGLNTLGQVAAMERNMLIDQFGPEGGWAWNLANGRDDRHLTPLKHQETVTEQTSLPFSSTSLEMLLVAVDILLRRAYARPAMRGRYAGRITLECPVYGTAPWEKTINFRAGIGQWEKASFIIRSQLEAEPPEVPIDGLSLTLSGFTGESGSQLGLLPDVREKRRGWLAEAERWLQSKTAGTPALYRVVQVAPWHPAPEMRAVQTPLEPSGGVIRPLVSPEPVEVREDGNRQPEAVRQQEQWRRVSRIAERWSFDLWWLPKPLTRIYYRVEREDGGQITLFLDQHEECWYQQGR